MRLHTDDQMQLAYINATAMKTYIFKSRNWKGHTIAHLKEKLKKYQRTRYYGSTVSKHSYIMMMVCCMYDEVTFLTNDGFEAQNGHLVNILEDV